MRAALGVLGVALMLASGCAQKDWIDRTLVTENVAGAWTGSWGEGNSYGELRLDLRQERTQVSGVATVPFGGATGVVVPFPSRGTWPVMCLPSIRCGDRRAASSRSVATT